MIKETIKVPAGIRFMSEWKEFSIPDYPCIIDKKIPGCGFTEYCITNNENVVLCSPRKLLLRNKEKQHSEEVLYVNNNMDQDATTDKDLEKFVRNSTNREPTLWTDIIPEDQQVQHYIDLKNQIHAYINSCLISRKPIKLLVTYDSFRIVKEALGENIGNFRIVIDEFQSIFTDSRFKASTELEFLYHLQDLKKVCFVSATPMIDEYLERLEEFKDLPYFELDWETLDPLRVMRPELKVRVCRSVNEAAYSVIKPYLDGEFESTSYRDENGVIHKIESREAVLYINSVTNILGIINKCKLTPDQCNVIIAQTPDNEKKIKRRLGKGWSIGDIPLKGEPRKMFTFCTRTVYLGADFYSDNARTFIMSDANIETLSVDISLDLPQILGRQRDETNPWKNRAEFFYKTSREEITQEMFQKYLDKKIDCTNKLLENYDVVPNKHELAFKYRKDTVTSNYKDDFIGVNQHAGEDMIPVMNHLVLMAEQRAFDIQQIDYKDRFAVFNTLYQGGLIQNSVAQKIHTFLDDFENLDNFREKMRAVCESDLNEAERLFILDQIPLTYKTYYLTLGPERCKANSYNQTMLKYESEGTTYYMVQKERKSEQVQVPLEEIQDLFKIGERYTNEDVKNMLENLYSRLGISKTPKATDLGEWFELNKTQITINGIRKNGYLIKGDK